MGSPTVVGGKVYIGSGTGIFYALNATTGKVVWQRLLDYGVAVNCAARGVASTAAVVPDPVTGKLTVYVAGAHFLYALDAATGAVKWTNSVGLRTARGLLQLGVADGCRRAHLHGRLVGPPRTSTCAPRAIAYNQHTGAAQHTYFDMPVGSIGGSVLEHPGRPTALAGPG